MSKSERIIFYVEAALSVLILIGGVLQDDLDYILSAMLLFQTCIQVLILKKVLEIGEFYE